MPVSAAMHFTAPPPRWRRLGPHSFRDPIRIDMSRLLRPLLVFVFLGLGAGIGALNADPVAVDLGGARFESPLGLVMLGCLLAGVLLGGLALTISVVLPMRRGWRRERDALRAAQGGSVSTGRIVTGDTDGILD